MTGIQDPSAIDASEPLPAASDGFQRGSYFGFAESQTALTFGEGVFASGKIITTPIPKRSDHDAAIQHPGQIPDSVR